MDSAYIDADRAGEAVSAPKNEAIVIQIVELYIQDV